MDKKMLWSDLKRFILSCDDNSVLREINQVILEKMKQNQAAQVLTFSVGDVVEFTGRAKRERSDSLWRGKIVKLRKRYLEVQATKVGLKINNPVHTWFVSPGICTLVTDEKPVEEESQEINL